MNSGRPKKGQKIDKFGFKPGRLLAGKYRVESSLGSGWEGEVYRVVEERTGIVRAAKLFFPHRNTHDRAVNFYAKKLDRLRRCSIVIQYIHSERIRYRGVPVTCLLSEYVDGELLEELVKRGRGGRLPPFEAMHVLYALVRGLEEIHRVPDYHGDLHTANVMVQRRGLFFDVKLVDFFHSGPPKPVNIRRDITELVQIFHEIVGGPAHYRRQPPEVKAICRGLRSNLILKSFPTARHLREHLERFVWHS